MAGEKDTGATSDALYSVVLALLPHLRMWDGTKIVEPHSAASIRQALREYSTMHAIGDVQVLIEPCKPKAHFTITQISRAVARDTYDRAIEWTAKSGEVALLSELAWLSYDSYPLAPSDVYVVPSSYRWKDAMAWFVFGRKREGRFWQLT